MLEDNSVQEIRQALRLYIALTRTHRSIVDMDLRNIRSYGFNATEFGVLELLFTKGPHPLQQIGDHILITSGTITYVIDKLEKKGLLVRKPCDKDRRIIYAEITAAGQEKMAEILPSHYKAMAEAFKGVSSEEKEQTINLLKKISFIERDG